MKSCIQWKSYVWLGGTSFLFDELQSQIQVMSHTTTLIELSHITTLIELSQGKSEIHSSLVNSLSLIIIILASSSFKFWNQFLRVLSPLSQLSLQCNQRCQAYPIQLKPLKGEPQHKIWNCFIYLFLSEPQHKICNCFIYLFIFTVTFLVASLVFGLWASAQVRVYWV